MQSLAMPRSEERTQPQPGAALTGSETMKFTHGLLIGVQGAETVYK